MLYMYISNYVGIRRSAKLSNSTNFTLLADIHVHVGRSASANKKHKNLNEWSNDDGTVIKHTRGGGWVQHVYRYTIKQQVNLCDSSNG